MSLEEHFDAAFTATLALREKQIQQSYRPIIGIHKWFARRPGTVFRNLLLAEFNGHEPVATGYWRAHSFHGVIADPFMGGGTPIFEANRLGFSVVGADVNPMAYWIVRQSLATINLDSFTAEAESVIKDVEREIGKFYHTQCLKCHSSAQVKYFLWVKVQACPHCGSDNDLFPGYLLAEATRHPKHVVACGCCGELNEFDHQPRKDSSESCNACDGPVYVDGPARRNRITCRQCAKDFAYPSKTAPVRPRHRLWAIEYHCSGCKPGTVGRFFKRPDKADMARYESAGARFSRVAEELPIPDAMIPEGDETNRLHRWGYRSYHEMFNERQLLGLGLLLKRIREVADQAIRHALLTVFSDVLRYQNMLCRYDTYALKCQDIFSVHGFPVGLVQCENNILGIPSIGSGGFRHFIRKYSKAKRYCEAPFETRFQGRRKEIIHVSGEYIGAAFTDKIPHGNIRQAKLIASPAVAIDLPPNSLDGVFTDPPYYDNVQYAELMDFCFVWLRLGLKEEIPAFTRQTTRSPDELTGNDTMGRDIAHFTEGLSNVFRHYANALKPGAPFVFTYHHNDLKAYVPIVVAILDAGLDCTAILPAPAEMGASLHIAKTESSVLDSIFVCRMEAEVSAQYDLVYQLEQDISAMNAAKIKVSEGDLRCLAAGHVARRAINELHEVWSPSIPLADRMNRAGELLGVLGSTIADAICKARTGAGLLSQIVKEGVPVEATV